jgi:hypothetical protein
MDTLKKESSEALEIVLVTSEGLLCLKSQWEHLKSIYFWQGSINTISVLSNQCVWREPSKKIRQDNLLIHFFLKTPAPAYNTAITVSKLHQLGCLPRVSHFATKRLSYLPNWKFFGKTERKNYATAQVLRWIIFLFTSGSFFK